MLGSLFVPCLFKQAVAMTNICPEDDQTCRVSHSLPRQLIFRSMSWRTSVNFPSWISRILWSKISLVAVHPPTGQLSTCIDVIDVTWLSKQPSLKYVPARWVGNRGDTVPWCVQCASIRRWWWDFEPWRGCCLGNYRDSTAF